MAKKGNSEKLKLQKYLSKKYHIAEKTLRYYGMPTGIKRAGKNGYIVIKIEGELND